MCPGIVLIPDYLVGVKRAESAVPKYETAKDLLFGTKVLFLSFPHHPPSSLFFKISDVMMPLTRILEVSASESMVKAFQIIMENKILSVPVYDDRRQKYIGTCLPSSFLLCHVA